MPTKVLLDHNEQWPSIKEISFEEEIKDEPDDLPF